MTQTNTKIEVRRTLGVRPGASRKLLERKAAEKAPGGDDAGAALETSFPASDGPAAEPAADAVPTVADAETDVRVISEAPTPEATAADGTIGDAKADAQPEPASAPSTTPAIAVWSPADEALFRELTARRKAAGFQTRGRDVSAQSLVPGELKPNPGTVVAVIVGLVAERGGSVTRAELLDAMAGATFPNAKAKPQDRDWCQGYVGGAVRSGFLALAGEAQVAPAAADQPLAEAA
jgi:hypothetical protein